MTGTTLVVVNSVCGCAARNARPAVALALQHGVKPDPLTTVFAGQDPAASERARSYFTGYAPSSPRSRSEGRQVVYMSSAGRSRGAPANLIADELTGAFDEYCR